MYICAACVQTVRGNFGQSDSPRRRVQFLDTQLRPVLCLPAVGGVGTNLDQILTIFFLGFLLLHASLMMPWMCPVCWFAQGRSRSAHEKLKRVKKELKTGQKRTQNGPKKNENLIFWQLIFWVPTFEAWYFKMFDGTDCANSSPLMRYERASNCFFGDPHHNLNYSVTKLVTLSH